MLVMALLAGAAAFAVTAVLGLVAPKVLNNRAFWATLLVALGFGVAAVMADANPTEVSVLDALLRFATVAGVTFLARYARRSAVAISTILVAAAAIGSPAAWLAAFAVGMAAATYLIKIRTAWAKAIEGGAVALVCFHLHWSSPAPLAVSLATVALAPIVFSGYRNLPRKARRNVRRTTFAGAAVLGGLILLGVLVAADARPQLELGLSEVQKGLVAVRAGDQSEAVNHFESAEGAFGKAHDALEVPWGVPARGIPVVAQQVRALRTIAVAGAELAGSGESTLSAANLGDLKVDGGALPLDRLRSIQQPLANASTVLDGVADRLDSINSHWLIPTLDHRLDRAIDRVREARDDVHVGSILVDQLPSLLGAEGPRTYFLAVQTPAELRGSGGVIGNFADLGANAGKVTLNRSGRILDLDPPPGGWKLGDSPEYLSRYSPFSPEKFFQNATASPDFPTAAKVIQDLYKQSGGPTVDGVIGMDPIGLAALLHATGPVKVPSWPAEITADNAAKILLFDQYKTFDQPDRVDFLNEVTDAAWRRLTTGSFSLARLAHGLASAVTDKHLMVVSFHDDEQRALAQLDASGGMPRLQGDFVGVVTQNAGGSKIDYFLRRSLRYEATVDPEKHELTASLDITLKNLAPSSGLPDYIIGNIANPPAPAGTNLLYVSVYSPWAARSAAVDDMQLLFEPQKEFDRWVYSFYVDIAPGGSRTIHFSLAGEYPAGDYRLDVLRQPTVVPDDLTTRLSVPSGWTLGDKNTDKRSISSSMLLHRDESLTVGIKQR